MTRLRLSRESCRRTRSISRSPLTSTIHFVLSWVYLPRRLPIPAANMIACILFVSALVSLFSLLMMNIAMADVGCLFFEEGGGEESVSLFICRSPASHHHRPPLYWVFVPYLLLIRSAVSLHLAFKKSVEQ